MYLFYIYTSPVLSNRTLGGILELISLIGNKLQLFLQLESAWRYYKHCWEKGMKEKRKWSTSFQWVFFLSSSSIAFRSDIITYCEVGRFILKCYLAQQCQFLFPQFNRYTFVALFITSRDLIKNVWINNTVNLRDLLSLSLSNTYCSSLFPDHIHNSIGLWDASVGLDISQRKGISPINNWRIYSILECHGMSHMTIMLWPFCYAIFRDYSNGAGECDVMFECWGRQRWCITWLL